MSITPALAGMLIALALAQSVAAQPTPFVCPTPAGPPVVVPSGDDLVIVQAPVVGQPHGGPAARDVVGRAAQQAVLRQIERVLRVRAIDRCDRCNRGTRRAVYLFRLRPGMSFEAARERLSRIGARIQRNLTYRVLQSDDESRFFADQWPLANGVTTIGTFECRADADINGPEGWAAVGGSEMDPPVAVAVVDTGVAYKHPDLEQRIWLNDADPIDGCDNDGNGYTDDYYGLNAVTAVGLTSPVPAGDPVDTRGHGTAVAGIIAAQHGNQRFLKGVAPHARIIICRACDEKEECSTCNVVRCLDWVAHLRGNRADDVDIVATNNSYGFKPLSGGGVDPAVEDGIVEHQALGMLFVAAAGNMPKSNDYFAEYPANVYRPNVISVAETDCAGSIAGGSSYGTRTVHVAAPGEQAPVLPLYDPNLPDAFTRLWGTSMAAPHVSGLVALMRNADRARNGGPLLGWKGLRNLVLAGGTPIADSMTITGRRLRAFEPCPSGSVKAFETCTAAAARAGSLSCQGQHVQRRLHPIRDEVIADVEVVHLNTASTAIPLAFLNIDCAKPKGSIEVTAKNACVAGNATVTLKDDGINTDQIADDGIYSANWSMPTGWRVADVVFSETAAPAVELDRLKICRERPDCSCP